MDTVKGLKGRQWSILIVLLLLNWLIFSSLARFIVQSSRSGPTPTRTAKPTFTTTATPRPPTATPTETGTPTTTPTRVLGPQPPLPTDTPVPGQPQPPAPAPPTQPPATPSATLRASAAPRTGRVTHTVQPGETLSSIAEQYGVNVWYIVWLNDISDPSLIHAGQQLTIPAPGEVIPSPTPKQAAPTATSPPAPAPTNTPVPPAPGPAPTDTPVPPPTQHQFTGRIERWWPNCGLEMVGKSKVLDANTGEAVNGVRIKLWNDWGDEIYSLVSGVGLTYGPGEYDIFLKSQPADEVWRIAAWDWQTGPNEYARVDSEVLTLHFDTNDCSPEGSGHQVAIVNWYRHW